MNFIYTLCNWYKYLRYLLRKKQPETGKIRRLHFITNAMPAPNGGIGGPSTSLSTMQEIIGNKFLDLVVKYSFHRYVGYFGRKIDHYSMIGALQWVTSVVKNEKETLYITHDCATAAALALAGKRYLYTTHTQGPVLEEMKHFGFTIPYLMKKLISSIEKLAYENALSVQFPSAGARNAFDNCKNKAKHIKYTAGPVIYNTLYVQCRAKKLRPIKREPETITFLSVGNITKQKGFDKHSLFFREYLKYHKGKVRYIVRGTGPLENQLIADMKKLQGECSHFTFLHIKQKVSGENLEYLREISDVYLMLHRISIFDMATLEMFGHKRTAVLSNIGGNVEFNKNNNLILVDGENYQSAAKELASADVVDLGEKCRSVYDTFFSNQKFFSSYEKLVKEIIKND